MIYSFSVSTDANTAEVDRQQTSLKLTAGIIHQVDIVFPSGCQAYLYVAINHGGHQLWPTNSDEYFHTDNETISFKEFYNLKSAPYSLDLYTYNLDDTYAHLVVVRLGVLKRDELQGVWLAWSEEVLKK